MQAKELPIKEIQFVEYFCVVSRSANPIPTFPNDWRTVSTLFKEEDQADLFIMEQKKFSWKAWYGTNEYKKFSILLPI